MTANTRLKLGIAFAVGGNLLFFTSVWVAWLPCSASFKAMIWSILFFAPEVGTLIGVALMGKENYERFKEALYKFVGRIKPAGDVGPLRHKIGLVMFFLPLVPAYLQAYWPQWLPDSSPLRWQVKAAADVLFLASFFVLGGDFWDKLHALFTREARACPPKDSAEPTEQAMELRGEDPE
jgi:hypothetical protein